MQISLGFHIIGLIMWVGGLLIIPGFLRTVKLGVDPQAKVVSSSRIATLTYVGLGAVITIASGIYQLASRGIGFYMKQGWFHGKMLGIVLLLVASVFLALEVRRISIGLDIRRKRLAAVHALAAVSFITNIFLTFIGRINL